MGNVTRALAVTGVTAIAVSFTSGSLLRGTGVAATPAPLRAVSPTATGAENQLIGKYFSADAAPRQNLDAAVAMAAAPSDVNPVAYAATARSQAQALPEGGKGAWRQVGTGGALLNDPAYAANEDRLPTTGIVLSIALDPRDKAGNTAYAGAGGGLWKTVNGGGSWTQMGIPSLPIGGVGVDPSDPDRVVAATGQAFQGGGDGGTMGVYVSQDAVKTWTRPAANVSGNGGEHVDISTDGTIFAATSGGLFRSTDHGLSFSDVMLPSNAAGTAPAAGPVGSWTSDVRVRPGHPQEVVAAVGYVAGQVALPDGTDAAPGNGLYVSMADGAPGSWKRVDITSAVTGWEQEPLKSADPIGRTTFAWTPSGDRLYALVADAGHRSAGVAAPVDDGTATLGVPEPAHPTSLNGLYAASGDDLTTWSLKADSETLTATPGSTQVVLSAASQLGYNAGIQAWYNGWVAVDPTTPTRVLLGEEEVFQSIPDVALNTPLTFSSIDAYVSPCGVASAPVATPAATCVTGLTTHPDQHAGAMLATPTGTRLWVGNDGGIFQQDSGTTGFSAGAFVSGAKMQTLLAYRAVEGPDGEVYAGLQDSGTALFPAGSNNSYEVCGGDGTSVLVSPTNPKILYCNANGALDVSVDGGATTTDISPSDAAPEFLPAALAMDPTDENHLITGGQMVTEETEGPNVGAMNAQGWVDVFDNGTTAAGVARATQAVDVLGADAYAASCAVCASSVKAAIGATDRQLATNVGMPGCTPAKASSACWHVAALAGMPAREISAIAIDPTDPKTLYIATETPSVVRNDFGDSQRVLVSHDAGATVQDISGDLPQGNTWDVKVVNGVLVVAADTGVFVAPKTGVTWARLDQNMPQVRSYGLSLSPRGDLVDATYGAGVLLYPAADVSAAVAGAPSAATTTAKPGTTAAKAGQKAKAKPKKATRRKSVAVVRQPKNTLAYTGLSMWIGLAGLVMLLAAALIGRLGQKPRSASRLR